MLVLRYKYRGERGWKTPPNFTLAGVEVPIGLASVTMALLAISIVNLFTKSVATVSGIIFSAVFFALFEVSERVNKGKFAAAEQQMRDEFQLLRSDTVARETVGIRPGNVLVTVRDYNTLGHLKWALNRINTDEQDLVVLSIRVTGPGSAEHDLAMEQIFSDYEQLLFTRTVAVAESVGKHISLLVVPARDVFSATVQTANNLESSAVVAGLSSKMTAQEQAFRLGQAWEAMPEPKRQVVFQVVRPDDQVETFRIGPHTPTMKTEDVHLVHRLWLNVTRRPGFDKIHHSDLVTLALTRLARDYGRDPDEILKALRKAVDGSHVQPALRPSPYLAETESPPSSAEGRELKSGEPRPEPPKPPFTGSR